MTNISRHAEVLNDPTLLLHRYIEAKDAFRFLRVPRHLHRESTFITDEYLPQNLESIEINRSDITNHVEPAKPSNYIFHSAYCCSTMLARAFDIEGTSMGLKEPVVLNDIVGWRHRGAKDAHVKDVLSQSLSLLSKPFNNNEITIIKPSNACNSLAENILEYSPNAKAILLYAPIESFLQSIAKKGMWGRIWARTALVGQLKDKNLVGGYSLEEVLQLTDLQIAALGWLSNHAIFGNLIKTYGHKRIKLLDSDTFLSNQRDAMSAALQHYGLSVPVEELSSIMTGPAFTSHSKLNTKFDADTRKKEQEDMSQIHGVEISMVTEWIKAVAESQNISISSEATLLNTLN